jgi:tetratricopeptide (TPR) repeat protein
MGMSDLRIERWTMPAADLGPDNPLPPFQGHGDNHAPSYVPGIPEEMLRNMAYGHVASPLPYTMQDGYGRALHPRSFQVIVLENDILRAAFFPELGGRLWSLVHKPSGRELLEANPIFQPANLAIRNAWFSGGVEWNIGVRGHSPFTCSPVFAAQVAGPRSIPTLRLYEWERARQVPFQIDAYLPDGSPMLLVRIRILNPHRREVPMYWWSNTAVPESPNTRVLAPADHAYKFGYGKGGLGVVPIPEIEGTDVTYPTHIGRSADFFFHVPDGERPWVTALDGEGKGLIQTSTGRLRGRKLFLWGMGPGGRRWQQFLSRPGHAYIEIQAGLARTQMEYLPMPPGAEWTWLEAYGLMEADPAIVHGSDWTATRRAVSEALERTLPRREMEAEFERGVEWADQPPQTCLQRGSGWGALENARRAAAGQAPFCGPGLAWGEIGAAQQPWLELLQHGALPQVDPGEEPGSYMVQEEWQALLERAVAAGRGEHWLSWLHLGVMRYHASQRAAARQAWERSQARTPTPWAARNLAALAVEEGQLQDAARWYVAALRMRPSLLPLAVECGRALIAADRAGEWLALLDEIPEGVRSAGRIRLLEGQAALAAGDLDRAERLFAEPLVIDDLREGERSLSHLWFDLHERRLSAQEGIPIDDELRARVRLEFPVPGDIDFRMSSDAAE